MARLLTFNNRHSSSETCVQNHKHFFFCILSFGNMYYTTSHGRYIATTVGSTSQTIHCSWRKNSFGLKFNPRLENSSGRGREVANKYQRGDPVPRKPVKLPVSIAPTVVPLIGHAPALPSHIMSHRNPCLAKMKLTRAATCMRVCPFSM